MLATLAGFLALVLGVSLLLLPLLVTELSRPRDSAWGAVVLLLGLVLVTSAERLTGAPMLAVLCGGLLVGRLGGEVAQGRWRALSDEERLALGSSERWSRSLNQLAAAVASLVQSSVARAAVVSAWVAERRQSRSHGKRWVRSETPGEPAAAAPVTAPDGESSEEAPSGSEAPAVAGAEGEEPMPPCSGTDSAPVIAAAAASTATDEPIGASEAITPTSGEERISQDRTDVPPPADPGVRIVADLGGIDALLAAAPQPQDPPPAAGAPVEPSAPASIPERDA